MNKMIFLATSFCALMASPLSAEDMQSQTDNHDVTFPVRKIGLDGVSQTLTGEAIYKFDEESESSPLKIIWKARRVTEKCTDFPDCSDSFISELIFETDGEISTGISKDFYDSDGRYLGSIDDEGIKCVAKGPALLPLRAAIGSSGQSDFEECSDGASTTSASWSLKAANDGKAEFEEIHNYSDGSKQLTSFLIDVNGNVFGLKIEIFVKEEGVDAYFRASNY